MRKTVTILLFFTCPLACDAADLAKVERKIGREPKYQNQPLYALIVFGSGLNPRVWMVLDGDTLYVDRNGNGDLTEPGESTKLENRNTDPASFEAVEIKASDNVQRKLRVWVYNWLARDKDRKLEPALSISDRDQRSYGAWGGWDSPAVWGSRPEVAPIFHVGGPLEMGFEQPARLVFRKSSPGMLELKVGVGTPGIGTGSFTHLKYWDDAIPEKAQPTAVLEFPNKESGGPPIRIEQVLKERC